MVTIVEFKAVLEAAAHSHHEFESVYLKGVRDELWLGYYAAFVLGRLADLNVAPSRLASLLEQAEGEDWADSAAELVIAEIRRSG